MVGAVSGLGGLEGSGGGTRNEALLPVLLGCVTVLRPGTLKKKHCQFTH